MDARIAARIAQAAARAPGNAGQGAEGTLPVLPGITLYIDGDGLAYYCAGNDETTVAEARSRVREKIDSMARACSASKVVILLTGSGGHKGHRYAVATVKAYQGQRSGARRPKNWQPLRDLLEAGAFGEFICDHDREADDRFAQFGHADPERTAIATQDKDMRMVPGYHVDWKDNRVFFLSPGQYEASFNDKVFGLKWFWLQMLMGDTADNIPGLPAHKGKKIGEVGATNLLAKTSCNAEALAVVHDAYRDHYGVDDYAAHFMEQAVLLWMRRCPKADWFDVAAKGGPLFSDAPWHYAGWQALNKRVQEADALNRLAAVQTQAQ